MKFPVSIVAATAFAALAACSASETENVQAKAEDTSQALEKEANQISAEAESGVQSTVDTLENQAAALDEQFEANGSAGGSDGNEAGNAASNSQ